MNVKQELDFSSLKYLFPISSQILLGIIHPNPGKKSDLYTLPLSLTLSFMPLSLHAETHHSDGSRSIATAPASMYEKKSGASSYEVHMNR